MVGRILHQNSIEFKRRGIIMQFESYTINRRMNEKWFFELHYIDKAGYKITIDGEGYASKEVATKEMDKAKKGFERDYGNKIQWRLNIIMQDYLVKSILEDGNYGVYNDKQLRRRSGEDLQNLADSMTLT